jgi:hypothetical protein
MALKVLSGLLVPKLHNNNKGEAIVTFSSHTVSGDASGARMHMVGATDDFIDVPCHTVALANIVIDIGAHATGSAQALVSSIDRNEMIVKWECTPQSKVRDISYMVIGETAEVVNPPTKP